MRSRPCRRRVLLCSGACSVQLSELSTGYGKFEYTREGVNQTSGVCTSRNAGYARIDSHELSLQLSRPVHDQGSLRLTQGLLSHQIHARRHCERLSYGTCFAPSLQRYGS